MFSQVDNCAVEVLNSSLKRKSTYTLSQTAPSLPISLDNHKLPANEHPLIFKERITRTGNNIAGQETTKVKKIDVLHGTTTLGFIFNGGVLIAVDSRSTMGPYVSSGIVKKVIEITPSILGTMAGGAADCEYWERRLGTLVNLYEMENKERCSISAASKLLSNILYKQKGNDLSVGTMISGYDSDGPHIFYCDNEGDRLEGQIFSVGSGSLYAYGVLETMYRTDLTDEEAIALGYRAIFHATHRDAMTGGNINVYLIKESGWTRYPRTDCFEMYKRIYGGEAPYAPQ